MQSLRAFFCGWAIYFLISFSVLVHQLGVVRFFSPNPWNGYFLPILFGGSVLLFFLIWVVLGIPISRYVPASNLFWKRPVRTTVGAGIGLLICIIPWLLGGSPLFGNRTPLIFILRSAVAVGTAFYLLSPSAASEKRQTRFAMSLLAILAAVVAYLFSPPLVLSSAHRVGHSTWISSKVLRASYTVYAPAYRLARAWGPYRKTLNSCMSAFGVSFEGYSYLGAEPMPPE